MNRVFLVIRVCSQLSEPDEGTGEMNERHERLSELVVSRGDASELLDSVEETLDEIPVFVEMPVERTGIDSVGARRNDGLSPLGIDEFDKGIRVVTLVCHNERCCLIFDQSSSLRDIGNLPRGQDHPQWIAQSIDGHMQFGGQPPSGTTDFLFSRFFWAPAECWWARTIVESRNRCSLSASPRKAVATRSQTPESRQREKRTYVRCQCPSSSGKSRHGLPVRMIHNTASTKRRLSLAVTPRSLAFPGKSCSIRAHWSSRNIFLPILNSAQKSGYDQISASVNSPFLCH